MSGQVKDGILTIFFEGVIDSSNAPAVEEEIQKIVDGNKHESLVFDFENLKYISSAGLRLVLKYKKADPTLIVINVKLEVYDVFEMTGFTKIMEVRKAYKNVSIEGCEIVGDGANGTVYRLDADTIVKVYKNPDSYDEITRERELAKQVFVLGVPTAISYDIVKVNNCFATVFEMIDAKSLAKILSADRKELDRCVDLYVGLLKIIHGTSVGDANLPSIKNDVLDMVKFDKDHLPEKTAAKLEQLVVSLKDRDTLIHGDYHLKNIMIQNGEPMLIDMDTVGKGHPLFELGFMYNAYLGHSCIDRENVKNFLGIDYDTAKEFWRKSLAKYLGTNDEARIDEVEDKAKIIGYLRLLRWSTRYPESATIQKEYVHYKEELIRLADKYDNLEI